METLSRAVVSTAQDLRIGILFVSRGSERRSVTGRFGRRFCQDSTKSVFSVHAQSEMSWIRLVGTVETTVLLRVEQLSQLLRTCVSESYSLAVVVNADL